PDSFEAAELLGEFVHPRDSRPDDHTVAGSLNIKSNSFGFYHMLALQVRMESCLRLFRELLYLSKTDPGICSNPLVGGPRIESPNRFRQDKLIFCQDVILISSLQQRPGTLDLQVSTGPLYLKMQKEFCVVIVWSPP